ncbi:MAG: hypothetical protein WC517_02650 [Patescibacteria group bacterium]
MQWYCEAFSTNLHEGPDRYRGETDWEKKNPESIWLREFKIESVTDHYFLYDDGPPLGKYLLEFWFEVYGNDRRVGVDARVNRRLQQLQDAGIISGFYLKRRSLIYFNPVKGEHFTRTALRVATEFFKVFGIPQYNWQEFGVSQETQFLSKNGEHWVDFTTHLKRNNEDLLGECKE